MKKNKLLEHFTDFFFWCQSFLREGIVALGEFSVMFVVFVTSWLQSRHCQYALKFSDTLRDSRVQKMFLILWAIKSIKSPLDKLNRRHHKNENKAVFLNW